MTPDQYYRLHFQSDLNAFMALVRGEGSISPGARVAGDQAFSVGDLCRPASWEAITPSRRCHFLHALSYSILVNMTLHCHFGNAWSVWRRMTRYPEMFGTMSSAWHHVSPSALFDARVLMGAGIGAGEAVALSAEWAAFIVEDLTQSLPTLGLPGVDAEAFFNALSLDTDAHQGPQGQALYGRINQRLGRGGPAAGRR